MVALPKFYEFENQPINALAQDTSPSPTMRKDTSSTSLFNISSY